MWGIKSQVFWCLDSILRPLFDLRWSWRSWPPEINHLWRSKYEINENRSCEVSNHKFFGVWILFWDPFITSNDPRGCEMTSEGQDMISMKISHRRYQITGFLDNFLTSDDHKGCVLQISMTLSLSKYGINENNRFYSHRL